jgi:hypothetical protein
MRLVPVSSGRDPRPVDRDAPRTHRLQPELTCRSLVDHRSAFSRWSFCSADGFVYRARPLGRVDAAAVGHEAVLGRGPATTQLLTKLTDVPADVVIVLSGTDLISFSVRWREGSRGVAAIRRADIPPLSLPNTVRNVIAHELGHVLGLDHNADTTTLMCGRPSPCRPAVFASDSARFFPLTAGDERRIAERWP